MSDTNLQTLTDALDYHHQHIAFTFDENGTLITDANGVGVLDYKLTVDPATYAAYINGDYYGQFDVTFPAGLFATLEGLQVTFASGSNGAVAYTVKSETAAGFTCFVQDVGGTTLSAFALWITAKGKLNSGKIP
jgi:hypothetical protein